MKTILQFLTPLLLMLWMTASPVQGAAVAVSSDVGDNILKSDGTEIGSTFTFEIGTFDVGFTPTLGNVASWEANWNTFARGVDGAGWNSVDRYFAVSANFLGDGSSSAGLSSNIFTAGDQLYLWVYDSRVTTGGPIEWALVTNDSSDAVSGDNWVLPDASNPVPGAGSFALSDASVVIYGGANNDYGAGIITVIPPDFQLQTAVVVVPEPGSALMILLAGAAIRLRRRRR